AGQIALGEDGDGGGARRRRRADVIDLPEVLRREGGRDRRRARGGAGRGRPPSQARVHGVDVGEADDGDDRAAQAGRHLRGGGVGVHGAGGRAARAADLELIDRRIEGRLCLARRPGGGDVEPVG